jgi:hypothetical protein
VRGRPITALACDTREPEFDDKGLSLTNRQPTPVMTARVTGNSLIFARVMDLLLLDVRVEASFVADD